MGPDDPKPAPPNPYALAQHLKRQVQSLLQRTDSMLSRSSDLSARQRSATASEMNRLGGRGAQGRGAGAPAPSAAIDTRGCMGFRRHYRGP